MKAILSADLNWGIGFKGKLLQRVPEDMKFFMKMTIGKVVVMGRETFESLPGKQPLKERVNIILSRNAGYDASGNASSSVTYDNASKPENLTICHSVAELFERLKAYPPEDIFVIGGESIYTQLLPYCSEVYVTRFEKAFEADRHFPDLDQMENWELAEEGEPHNYNGMGFRFLKYVNQSVLTPS
jgi:dihydrofolate reductase